MLLDVFDAEERGVSRPLFELEAQPQHIPRRASFGFPAYSFSNDNSAEAFITAQQRERRDWYKQSCNRVALVVGESALAGALDCITEDTIVLVDKAPRHTVFMKRYRDSLRRNGTLAGWRAAMGLDGHILGAASMRYRLAAQIDDWVRAKYPHGLQDQTHYQATHRLASTKAIVPWTANIGSPESMDRLAGVLKDLGATITFLNLTNAISVDAAITSGQQIEHTLSKLPLADEAPIIASSSQPRYGQDPYIVRSLGPYGGLRDLLGHWSQVKSSTR